MVGGPAGRWPAAFGTWLVGTTLLLTALAQMGWFLPPLVLLAGMLAGSGAVLWWRPGLPRAHGRGSWTWAAAALAVLVLGALLVGAGSEHIVGPRDPGVYLATATRLARQGSLHAADPALQRLGVAIGVDPERAWVFRHSANDAPLRYPAPWFVHDMATGAVEPGFLPGLVVWVASAFLFGGLEPALHVSGAFGVIGLAFAMLTWREARRGAPGDRVGALLVGLLLATSFGQVWWARELMAESALGAFAWIGAWALTRWRATGVQGWASLGALAGVAALFARADGVLITGAFGAILVWGWIGWRDWRERMTPVTILGLGTIWYVGYAVTGPATYLALTYGPLTRGRAAAGLALLAILVLGFALGPIARRLLVHCQRRFDRWHAERQRSIRTSVVTDASGCDPQDDRDRTRVRGSPQVLRAGVTVLFLVGVWLARQGTLAWLPGYLPWPWLLLAAVGGLALLWGKWPPSLAPALLVGGMPALFYLPDPLVTVDHPWMVRRLVPVVAPLLVMLTSAGAVSGLTEGARLGRRRSAGMVVVGALLGLGFGQAVVQVAPVVQGTRHGTGIVPGLHELATLVPTDAFVVFPDSGAGRALAMPLSAVHGIDTVAIPESALTPAVSTVLSAWAAQEIPVYWAAGSPLVTPPDGVQLTLVGQVTVEWATADLGATPPPLRLQQRSVAVWLYRVA